MTNFRKMSKNYVFREFECGLTVEETAKLCFKTVSCVTKWDKGKPIPPECKRLMRMAKRLELSHLDSWQSFKMHKGKLELPTGQLVTAQEVLTGIALVEIQTPDDIRSLSKLMKYVRTISKIKNS